MIDCQKSRLVAVFVCLALMLVSCSDSQPSLAETAVLNTASTDRTPGSAPTTVSPPAPAPVVQPAPAPVVQPAPAPVVQPAPAPVVQPAPAPVVQPAPITAPIPEPDFNVQVSYADNRLIEGDANGLVFTVGLSRNSNHSRTVDLRVENNLSAQSSDLVSVFSQTALTANQNTSELTVNLPVAVAPIQPHTTSIRIFASDGIIERSQSINISIQPVPAPDVYLLIGQSNMVGSSFPGARDTSAGGSDELNARIRQLNVRQNSDSLFSTPETFSDASFNVLEPAFVIAEDPLHEPHFPGQNRKEGSHIGLGLSFAKGMLDHTTQNIVLVPAAWSSSGFCRGANSGLSWNVSQRPGSAFGSTLLLDRAMTRLNLALRESGGIFRGILWHQGEADSNDAACAAGYGENIAGMVAHIRNNAVVDRRGPQARGNSATIPFIVGTMSRGDDPRGEFSLFGSDKIVVDNVHRTITTHVPFSTHVNADDLVPPAFPCGASSCVHFGATALRELGFRYHLGMRSLQQQ